MLSPTWNHAARSRHPALESQPPIEALIEEVTARESLAERVVVVDGDIRLRGSELSDRVRRIAGGLRLAGLSRGAAVAFQMPSWWETIALYRACWRLGMVAVPIHHLAGEAEVARLIGDVDPSMVVAAPDVPASSVTGVLEVRGNGRFEELLEAPPFNSITAEPTDVAVVLFTSGSTGGPKGVMHTHRALAYKATSLLGIHGLDSDDVVLMPAPMAHISGLSNAVMLPGAGGLRSVLMAKWSPTEALELIRREGVTFMMGPPTFFQTMLAAPNFSPEAVASLRLISCGGAGVTASFATEASSRFDAVVKRTYGSTEAPVVSTWHAGDPPERAVDCDGRAAADIEIRLVAPDTGRELAPGEAGEIWVRGPELFVGYTDPSRNEGTVTVDGWLRTGDLGALEEGGWLRVVGRIKDIIIRGGENISAAEVEAVLESHPEVRQAVVVGYPDPRLGERACAFVVASSGRTFDLAACRDWFAETGVTKFKWPERVEQIDEIPVLPSSGKADRAALRRLAAHI